MTPIAFLDGRVTVTCHCGKDFMVSPARFRHGRGKCCSPKCQYDARRAARKVVSLTCIGCGSKFNREPSRLTRAGGGKYCSRPCRDKHWKGDKNPNWQNGDSVYKRGPHWHSIRRRIIERDKVCQHCGAAGKLHVHHRIPFRVYEDKTVANQDWNLVAICPPCHRKEDARYKWANIGGGVLIFPAGGAGWEMARQRGMV